MFGVYAASKTLRYSFVTISLCQRHCSFSSCPPWRWLFSVAAVESSWKNPSWHQESWRRLARPHVPISLQTHANAQRHSIRRCCCCCLELAECPVPGLPANPDYYKIAGSQNSSPAPQGSRGELYRKGSGTVEVAEASAEAAAIASEKIEAG